MNTRNSLPTGPETAAPQAWYDRPMRRRTAVRTLVLAAVTLPFAGSEIKDDRPKTAELSPEDVLLGHAREHLEAKGNVDWKPRGEISPKDHFKCADGREKEGAGGTFGGGVGRFIGDVTGLQRHLGRRLTRGEVDALLDDVIADGLYLHTDHHAVEKLAKKMHLSSVELHHLMRNPGDRKEEIVNNLLDDKDGCECIGCAHLRFMASAKDSAAFKDLDRGLVQHVLRRVEFERLAGVPEVREEELEDEHNELAVLDIDGSDDSETLPLIRHADDKRQFFVINRAMERVIDKSFIGRLKKLNDAGLTNITFDEGRLMDDMQRTGAEYTGVTKGKLEKKAGKTFPVIEARFEETRRKIDLIGVQLA